MHIWVFHGHDQEYVAANESETTLDGNQRRELIKSWQCEKGSEEDEEDEE
jgi:hypothetical protein